MVDFVDERLRGAETLRAQASTIAAELAALISDWPRHAASYRIDPDEFARLEMNTLVEYVARLIETGDESFCQLYIGEKAKQFHDPAAEADARRHREALLLEREREIFSTALAPDPVASRMVHTMFDAVEHAMTAAAKVEVKALFVGDCLYLDVISFLTAPALVDGVRLKPTYITAHSANEIHAQIAKLAEERFDAVFYSPFTYAMLSDYDALQRPRGLLQPIGRRMHKDSAVADGVAVFDALADLFDCPIVAHAPAPILRSEGSRKERAVELLTLPALTQVTKRLGEALRERAKQRNAQGHVIHIVDERMVAGPGGLKAAGRYLFRSDRQHPAAFGALLASWYRDILLVIGRLRTRKLVVCDLDNTLWDGVIGEGHGVVHHHDRQATLLALKARGVVLAINSKNDAAKAVWHADEGALALDDFVSRQINWDPKLLNMSRIAEHLNLKEKDFVFIDDRADERAMIDEALPSVLTLDALDERAWRLLALWSDLLPRKPGADRTNFYRQRDERQKFITAAVETSAKQQGELMSRLGLTLVVRQASNGDVHRVADLINRTNQFNMTGGRITHKQLQELIANAGASVLIADASDRFGNMGTISVLIVVRDKAGLTIPFFVLSCRVFGYGMEFAILEEARRFARPGESLFGPLVETAFNEPCRNVYAAAGFHAAEGGWRLGTTTGAAIDVPRWLAVKSNLPNSVLVQEISSKAA